MYLQCNIATTSFPGPFSFELGRRLNSKGKNPGNEVDIAIDILFPKFVNSSKLNDAQLFIAIIL